MSVETQLRELVNLCRRAGEYTAWLAPKIEVVIANMAHERTAEAERRDVLAFLHDEIDKQEAATEALMLAAARERCSARTEILHTMAAYIKRGDHVGAVARKDERECLGE